MTSWNEFKREMRKNFYPLGYEDQLFLRRNNLKQGQGQSVEDFYEEYQDYIIWLDIQDPMDKLILKFVGGIYGYIRHKLEMFPLPSLQEEFRLALKIEAKRKASTLERKVSLILETSSSSSSNYSSGSLKKKKKRTNKKTSLTWRKASTLERKVSLIS